MYLSVKVHTILHYLFINHSLQYSMSRYDRLTDEKLVSLHYTQIFLLFAWILISTAKDIWLKFSHLKKTKNDGMW